MTDPVGLLQLLIRCDSVTPARGAVFDVLEAALTPLGFAVERFTVGEPPAGPGFVAQGRRTERKYDTPRGRATSTGLRTLPCFRDERQDSAQRSGPHAS